MANLKSTVRFARDYQSAIALEADDLTELWKLLASRVGPTIAFARCQDHVTREFSSARKLLEFNNSRPRGIHTLSLLSRSADHRDKNAVVRFQSQRWSTIRVEIEASEPVVTRLSKDLESLLDGVKAWYRFPARLNFLVVVVLLFLVPWLAANLALATGWLQPSNATPSPKADAIFLWLQLGFIATGIGLDWLKARVFPIVSFRLGHGERRYRRLNRLRLAICVAFPVSLLAGLISRV